MNPLALISLGLDRPCGLSSPVRDSRLSRKFLPQLWQRYPIFACQPGKTLPDNAVLQKTEQKSQNLNDQADEEKGFGKDFANLSA